MIFWTCDSRRCKLATVACIGALAQQALGIFRMRTLARVKESDNNNNNTDDDDDDDDNNNNNNFGPVRILMRARAVCTMVTFWSWMVAVRTSTFTVRILGWRESR